jgi:hypothetical protein
MVKSSHTWINKSRDIDRGLGKYAERLSRLLWPWRERWLLVIAGILCFFDFLSTYLLLDVIGRTDVYESGFLARWALEIGGFFYLFIIDLIAIVIMSLLAFGARYVYVRQGLNDYGRAAFVFILFPYIVITILVIANNILILLN